MKNEMTDAQINAAVAECCGWTKIAPWALDSTKLRGYPPNDNAREFVPKFATSRDAMAGALEKLSDDDWDAFTDVLSLEISPAVADCLNDSARHILSLPPKQLCLAFLKTKGKL